MQKFKKKNFRWPAGLGLWALLLCGVVACEEKTETKPAPPGGNSQVASWLTTPDKASLFQKQRINLNFRETGNNGPTIAVDTSQVFQTMDGFGFTLTTSSAYVISRLNTTDRANLLQELFAADSTHIGISYLRLNLGASDLSPVVYSYNDLPEGQADPDMQAFSLAPDRAYYLPVLKQILAVNPGIKLLATPWSPPAWMKTNASPKGGKLKPEYYAAYARYLLRYLQDMRQEGIAIEALTVQNEPLHDGNNPSMYMSAAEQGDFIKNHLGPALRDARLATKIILYDHNLDQPNYPISILNDAAVKPYVDGSAFHLYAGDINAMASVHQAHPDKHLYFTEQYTAAGGSFAGDLSWHVKNLVIGATRNWSRNVLEWNLAADAGNGPYTPGGCNTCLPAVTVANGITRNVAYYIIGQAAKFVRPGSRRVASNVPASLPNVAFQRPDGKKVLIVLNESGSTQSFNIGYRGKVVAASLPAGAVATYVW
ncbi:MAG: glycoside hydrolase family 30 protein [Adhaeribacter sp.]